MKKTDFLVYMQASDMMCRYESRALSASDMGNKSFRFRISALIWSRRALDAPLVERYIVAGCCGELSKIPPDVSWRVVSGVLFNAVPRLKSGSLSPRCVERQVVGKL